MSNTSGLLRCPKNLKECIDWLLCIHGQKKIPELASAVENVLGVSHPVPIDLEALASGLADFIGYSGSAVTGRGIVRRDYVKFFEDLSSNCPCVSSHPSSCPHCEALSRVFPNGSCKDLCVRAQKFQKFVDEVKNILGKLGSVQNIEKSKISSVKTSFEAFTSAFGNLQNACESKPPEAFSSTPGSPSQLPHISEGLYGFLHSGVEGWSKALERALEEAEKKADGKPLEKNSEEFKALVSALKVFLSNLKAQYVLVYSSATWDSLCSSSKSCSGCSFSSYCPCRKAFSFSNYSCDGSCCDYCDVKKAAKIFLGMLPCLYYGLKIVFDRSKYDSGFAGWNLAQISEAPQLRKFLEAWGFSFSYLNSSLPAKVLPGLLEKLFGSPYKFQILYDLVSLNYFSHSLSSASHSPSPPKTVRQMLLWLYGLRFQKHFPSLVSHSEFLCSPFGNSYNADAFCYYLHVSCSLLPVSVLTAIQFPDGSYSFLPSPSEWTSFSYPSDTSALLEMLCDFVRKVFVALTFLRFQCERIPGHGGWAYCYFGQKCSVEPLSSGSAPMSPGCSCSGHETYLCSYSSSKEKPNKDVHSGHCALSGGTCINSKGCNDSKNHNKPDKTSSGSNCVSCPHPLMRFLCDSGSQPKDSKSPFKPPEGFPKMGFRENLSSTAKSGLALYAILTSFCQDGFYPLTRLTEFALCVSRHPPDTLGELFAFFGRLAEALNSKTDPLKDHFVQWINGEPGFYPGLQFTGALKRLLGSKDSHWSSGTHKKDFSANLYSLYDCSGPKGSNAPHPTCGKYLYPLTYNVYDFFPNAFLGTFLSYVCYLAPTFEKKLKEFKTEFSSSCSDCSSGTSCTSIVKCPCILPRLYAHGFSFWGPKVLSCEDQSGNALHGGNKDHEKDPQKCTRKTCQNFIDQLGKVLGLDSDNSVPPIKNLLRIIDNFLWHIRLPFIYAFLYIWILVISYFYYVQFYKLDLLHIDSHLHLPRSFKILPSTLFSDASSKLKDLSYFTL